MKAFILCAGLGQRMRPLSYSLPKASIPFLNLPLMSYGLFYLEQLGLTKMICNSHLFFETLKKTIDDLASSRLSSHIAFESQPLGSAGGLYKVRSFFEKEKAFLYLNSDSLFFPSSLKALQAFKEDFLSSSFQSSFFASPMEDKDKNLAGLWIDENNILCFIGSKENLSKKLIKKDLRLVYFSGLAIFRSHFLKDLNSQSQHIFLDVIKPQLEQKKYKVFVDDQALVLEAGKKLDYLKATQLCLEELFSKKQNCIQDTLCSVFNRFDPEDKKVGLNFSQKQFKKNSVCLLASPKTKGLEHLKVKNFCVLNSQVKIFKKSKLSSCVLSGSICWKGDLEQEIIVKTF